MTSRMIRADMATRGTRYLMTGELGQLLCSGESSTVTLKGYCFGGFGVQTTGATQRLIVLRGSDLLAK